MPCSGSLSQSKKYSEASGSVHARVQPHLQGDYFNLVCASVQCNLYTCITDTLVQDTFVHYSEVSFIGSVGVAYHYSRRYNTTYGSIELLG